MSLEISQNLICVTNNMHTCILLSSIALFFRLYLHEIITLQVISETNLLLYIYCLHLYCTGFVQVLYLYCIFTFSSWDRHYQWFQRHVYFQVTKLSSCQHFYMMMDGSTKHWTTARQTAVLLLTPACSEGTKIITKRDRFCAVNMSGCNCSQAMPWTFLCIRLLLHKQLYIGHFIPSSYLRFSCASTHPIRPGRWGVCVVCSRSKRHILSDNH